MSKRGAGSYLTDQNWDHEEEAEEAGSFSHASTAELGKRQIRKAKRRGGQGEETGTAAAAFKSATGSAAVFKGFSGFTGLSGASTATSTPSFNFGGESKPLSFLSNGASANKSNAPAIAGSSFKTSDSDIKAKDDVSKSSEKNTVATSSTNGAKKSSNRCRYLQQLRALNESVTKWIQQHVQKNASCILTPIFRDYEKHLAEIEQKYPENEADSAESSGTEVTTTVSVTAVSALANKSKEQVSSSSGFKFSTDSSAVSSTKSETSEAKPLFSFGLSKSSGSTEPASGFSFSSSTAKASSSESESKPSLFGNLGSGSVKPFSFAVGATKAAEGASNQNNEDEEYVPPKAEVVEIKEDGCLYSKRCKLFYQKDGNWLEKGVGNLHLKELGEKIQLLIRADTNLGNILLNIMLTNSLPIKRQGKNNVSLICIPNPPLDPKDESHKPVSMLLRVKTGDDADELEKKMNELKK